MRAIHICTAGAFVLAASACATTRSAAASSSTASSASASSSMTGACLPDTADVAVYARGNMRAYATMTDSISAAARRNWGIPRLPADSVTLVSDPAECRRAALFYARAAGLSDTTTTPVAVVRVHTLRVIVRRPPPAPPAPPFTISTGSLLGLMTDSSYSKVMARQQL